MAVTNLNAAVFIRIGGDSFGLGPFVELSLERTHTHTKKVCVYRHGPVFRIERLCPPVFTGDSCSVFAFNNIIVATAFSESDVTLMQEVSTLLTPVGQYSALRLIGLGMRSVQHK